MHPLDREAVEDGLQRLAESGSTAVFRVRLASKGGGWRWTEWSTTPDPRSDLFYCVGRDINERVEAERALKRERRQLADAQEIASVGSWEFAPATGERTWSAQNFRNHGFEPGGPTPDPDALLERIHPEDRAKAAELFAELDDDRHVVQLRLPSRAAATGACERSRRTGVRSSTTEARNGSSARPGT